MRATYLDSSAIVKLVVAEPESRALRTHLKRRRPLVSSALARTEVLRALLPAGETALSRGREVLRRLDLVRINDRVLDAASILEPVQVRSLDAVHLATAQLLGEDLGQVITYDDRMADAARSLGLKTTSPM
jgi:predicted nucleic acid-binding protein